MTVIELMYMVKARGWPAWQLLILHKHKDSASDLIHVLGTVEYGLGKADAANSKDDSYELVLHLS